MPPNSTAEALLRLARSSEEISATQRLIARDVDDLKRDVAEILKLENAEAAKTAEMEANRLREKLNEVREDAKEKRADAREKLAEVREDTGRVRTLVLAAGGHPYREAESETESEEKDALLVVGKKRLSFSYEGAKTLVKTHGWWVATGGMALHYLADKWDALKHAFGH